ncbi:hypothetical protein AD951_07660 [Acetobacter malorum]|uniref:Uncharacterized protein n=1 Tax=Acetobacter malorum TaxID=178901 RepID=A0A149UMN8_9PROT|nr:hypothetical protein [Acetobacter malorum]KXV69207.1 hypothetical protein AD951_07660 [Acetobacter malorum]
MRAGFAAALVVMAGAASMSGARAQSSGCLVQQASQAALQRRLAEIDGLKTNVNSYFSGSNSCISDGLLNNFDLSSAIPDMAGLLNTSFTQLAQQALTAAKQQACQIAQGEIQNAVGSLNNEMSQYTSQAGNSINSLLGGYTSVSVPSIAGFGTYTFNTPTVQSLTQGNTTPPTTGTTINNLLGTATSRTSGSGSRGGSSGMYN